MFFCKMRNKNLLSSFLAVGILALANANLRALDFVTLRRIGSCLAALMANLKSRGARLPKPPAMPFEGLGLSTFSLDFNFLFTFHFSFLFPLAVLSVPQ